MDSQFNTLARSYHDNFLQYKLTGNSSYQQAYQSAKDGMDKIIATMSDENQKKKKDISDFYNQDLQGQMRDTRNKKQDTQRKIVSENDQLVSAEMRSPQNITTEPVMPNRWMALGVMSVVAVVLGLM